MNLRQLCFVTLLLVLLGTSTATAEKLAGLQVEYGSGVDPLIQRGVERALARAGSSGKWSWIKAATARAALPPGTLDCFTTACLHDAHEATAASAGMRVRFSAEAQIYDWTIEVYDLHTGKLASTKKGACELCGQSEVHAEFEASARAAVAAARITRQPKRTDKPVADARHTEPEPTVAKTPTRSDELPPLQSGDVTAAEPAPGLVMVEINVTPADASISIGDQQIGTGNVTVSLEHGTYDIAFAREGYGGLEETLVVGPQMSKKALLRVHLARTDPEPVLVAVGEGPIDRLGERRKLYGIVGLASGGVLLGTGILLSSLDGKPSCSGPVESCPRLYETSGMAFVTTLTGAALATSGAVLLAWDVLAGRREQRTAKIVPILTSDGAGLGVVGRF